MKYMDQDGDLWEELPGDEMVCVQSADESYHGIEKSRADVEAAWGPLTEAPDEPEDELPTVSDVMDRADVFQNAHALVTGLEWGESEKPSVYDVLQVAKWLEGEG